MVFILVVTQKIMSLFLIWVRFTILLLFFPKISTDIQLQTLSWLTLFTILLTFSYQRNRLLLNASDLLSLFRWNFHFLNHENIFQEKLLILTAFHKLLDDIESFLFVLIIGLTITALTTHWLLYSILNKSALPITATFNP